MLRQIAKTLKPNGMFVAVLPSFDAVEYLKKLEFKRFKESRAEDLPKLLKTKPLKSIVSYLWACLDTWKLFHRERRMNRRKKLYADDNVNIQRFIQGREIKSLLAKAGLTLRQSPEKLHYSWDLAKRFNYGYFLEEEEIWDWFIVAWKGENESS